jgi:hypothetical protein
LLCCAADGATFVKWCGLLLNMFSLEVQGDYTRWVGGWAVVVVGEWVPVLQAYRNLQVGGWWWWWWVPWWRVGPGVGSLAGCCRLGVGMGLPHAV